MTLAPPESGFPPPHVVVVADASPAIRGFLQHTLQGDPRVRLVAVAPTLRAALEDASQTPVDVAVVGLPQGAVPELKLLESLRMGGASIVALLDEADQESAPRARFAQVLLRRPSSTAEAFALAAPLLSAVLRCPTHGPPASSPAPPPHAPARPALRQPSQHTLRQPSRPALRQPSQHTLRQPSQHTLRQPSTFGHGEPQRPPQPARPALRQPSQHTLRQPSQQAPRQPARPALRQPSQHTLRQPSGFGHGERQHPPQPGPQLRQPSQQALRQPSHSGRRTPARAPAPPPSAVHGRPARLRGELEGQVPTSATGAPDSARGRGRVPTGVAGRPRRASRVQLSTGSPRQIFVSLVAMGASMGGVEAVERVLRQLPDWCPPVLIVQHMPAPFVPPYAHRLDGVTPLTVRVVHEPTPLRRGVALIAPGDRHLVVERSGGHVVAVPLTGPRMNLHRPSVGVLFESVARVVGAPAVGVILTGMGSDGAEGLATMRRAGARTIAQDAATSVVHGMPGAAISLGAAERIKPLDRVAESILELATEPPRAASVTQGVAG